MDLKSFSDQDIKGRPSVGINERWFKAIWPLKKETGAYKNMIALTKAYKTAKRGASPDALIAALNALQAEATQVAPILLRETNGKKKLNAAIKDDFKALDQLIEREKKQAMTFGNASEVVFDADFGAELNKRMQKDEYLSKFDIPSARVTHSVLQVVMNEIRQKKGEGKLKRFMDSALKDSVEDCYREIKGRRSLLDFLEGDLRLQNEVLGEVNDLIAKHRQNLAERVAKVPTTVISKMGLASDLEREYNKRLSQLKPTGAKGTLKIGVAVGSIFLPGTQEVAIAAAVRTAIGVIGEIVDKAKGAEKQAKELEKMMSTLSKTFEDGAQKWSSEMGATFVNSVLGTDVMPTIKAAKGKYKKLQVNVAHVTLKSARLSRQVKEIPAEIKMLQAKIAGWDGSNKSNAGKIQGQYKKELESLRRAMETLPAKAAKVEELAGTLEAAEQSIKARLNLLEVKCSKYLKGATFTLKGIAELGAIAGGGLGDAANSAFFSGKVFSLGEKVSATVIAGGSALNDLRDHGKELKAMVKG